MGFLSGLFGGKDKKAVPSSDHAVVDVSNRKPIKEFYSKVVGVTFKNDNGSDRQAILKKCRQGEKLHLVHKPTAEYPEAMAVCRANGEQLGHLKTEVAEEVLEALEEGIAVGCEMSELTGGTKDRPTRGCNILVCFWDLKESR